MLTAERDKLILEGVKEIKYVLGRYVRRIPTHIEYGDLVSESILAVMESVDKWDSCHASCAKFSTFVRYRIKGAMLDFMRSSDVPIPEVDWDIRGGDKGKFAEQTYISAKLHSLDMSGLTRSDLIWLELYFNRGIPQGVIAKKVGVAPSWVTVCIWKVIQKIRDDNGINMSGTWPKVDNNGNGHR